MERFTQSGEANCWQTAVACVLEVEPALLPDQMLLESPEYHKALKGWGSYCNILNGYLGKHHGLRYVDIQEYQIPAVLPRGEFHVMIGPTVRTETLRNLGKGHIYHCVVGQRGVQVWDVHPSRAGLMAVHSWGLLCPVDEELIQKRANHHDPMFRLVFNECLCPSCGNVDKLLVTL